MNFGGYKIEFYKLDNNIKRLINIQEIENHSDIVEKVNKEYNQGILKGKIFLPTENNTTEGRNFQFVMDDIYFEFVQTKN
jgi:hypothetical protein